jgi:hypothetical protein
MDNIISFDEVTGFLKNSPQVDLRPDFSKLGALRQFIVKALSQLECPPSFIHRMLEKMSHSKVLFEFTVTMTFSVTMRIFMRILPWIRLWQFPRCQNIFIYLSDHSTPKGHKTIGWPQISNYKYLKLCNPALLRSPHFFPAIIPPDKNN